MLVEQEQIADLPATITVSEQSWRDEIAPEFPLQIPFIQPERIDFDHTPENAGRRTHESKNPKSKNPRVEELRAEEPRDSKSPVPSQLTQIDELEEPIAEAGEPSIPADEADKREEPSPVPISAPRRTKADRRGAAHSSADRRSSRGRPSCRSRDSSSLAREVEWPSAKDILATHSASSSRLPATGGLKSSRKKNGAACRTDSGESAELVGRRLSGWPGRRRRFSSSRRGSSAAVSHGPGRVIPTWPRS